MHAMAQQGLGFDLATGECFTTALLKKDTENNEFSRIWKMILPSPLHRDECLMNMFDIGAKMFAWSVIIFVVVIVGVIALCAIIAILEGLGVHIL